MGMDWMDFKRVEGIEKRLAEAEAAIRALTGKLNAVGDVGKTIEMADDIAYLRQQNEQILKRLQQQSESEIASAKEMPSEPDGAYYFFRSRNDGDSVDLCVVPHSLLVGDTVVISLETRRRIQTFIRRRGVDENADRYFRNATECREINEHMALNAILCSAIRSMSKSDSQKCIDAYTAYCKAAEISTSRAYFKQASRIGVLAIVPTAIWNVSDVSSRNRSRQPSRKFDLSNGRVNDIASVVPESSIEWHRQEVAKSKAQGPDANSFHTEITKAESLALISHGAPAEAAEKITLWFAWHLDSLDV